MSAELRDKYIGNLVPEGAEEQSAPPEWGKDVQVFSLGTIMLLVNFADVVIEVWDEDGTLPDIEGVGLEPFGI